MLPGCNLAHLLDRETFPPGPAHAGSFWRAQRWFGVHTSIFNPWSRGLQGPGSHSLAGDEINVAQAALYAGHTLVLYSSLSAAGLLSFIAGCRPVSGADAQPDNEQYISLVEGHGEPVGEEERAWESQPDLLFLHSQTKQNHWPARVIKDPWVVIETTFGARWLLMHEWLPALCARERSEFCWWLKKERKKESEEEREPAQSPGLGGWHSEKRLNPAP